MSNPLEWMPDQRLQEMYDRAEIQAAMTVEYMELLQRELARRASKMIGEQE